MTPRWVSITLAFCIAFLGVPPFPFGHLTEARADSIDAEEAILRLESVRDQPDPFSPNGDGRLEATTLSAQVAFRPEDPKGVNPADPKFLKKLEEDRQETLEELEKISRDGKGRIRVTWRIRDSGTGQELRQFVEEVLIGPPFSLEVLPTTAPRVGHFLVAERSRSWDGRDQAGRALADGVYPYTAQAVFLLLKFKEGGSRVKEKILLKSPFASGSVTLDTTPPAITDLLPQNGTTLNDPRPTFSAHYSDSLSGVDPSSVRLSLDGADVTAQAAVTPDSIRFTPAANLPNGDHLFDLHVSDRAGNLGLAQTTFTVRVGNRPPALNPIGNQTVAVGSALQFAVSATDPDGDPVNLSVVSVPLPAHASFNLSTGQFRFTPGADQAGSFPLTFSAGDGKSTDSETITINVQPPPPGQVTALSGQLLDTNDFVRGVVTPVVGGTVSLLGAGPAAVSGPDGRFLLSGIPPGSQVLDIDTSTANPAPDGSPYGGFREEITLIEGAANVVDRPFFLPRIDRESLTTVDPNVTTVVTNPTLHVTMAVPPHSAKNPDGTDFTGMLSISLVAEGLAPAALPPDLQPGLLITIQPVGVTFDPPVPITFPNIDHLPPGTEVDIWSLDAENGVFVVVGTGRVTADGSRVETISGGIVDADWHGILSLAGLINIIISENNQEHQNPPGASCPFPGGLPGTTVIAKTGGLTVDPELPATRSLGIGRGLEFIYDSTTADPRPILPFNATVPIRAAVPPLLSHRLSVAGLDQGADTFVDTSSLDENRDETIRDAVQFDASGFATGRYPYTLRITSHYLQSAVSATLQGQVLVNNQLHSPFGAGWGLDGLQRLHQNSDGSLLITDGNGEAAFFRFAQTASGLVAYWPFNDGGNPTKEVVGNRDGFLSGSPTFTLTDVPPVQGNVAALNFDDPGDQVVIQDPEAFRFSATNPVTFSLWLKQTEQRDIFHVFGKRDGCSASPVPYQTARDLAGAGFGSIGGSSRSALLFGSDFPFNAWTHVAITYDGAGLAKFYLNGLEVASNPNFVLSGDVAALFRIGSSGDCPNSETFPGILDEFQIFSRALTPEEIASLAAGIPVTATGSFLSPSGDFSRLVKNAGGTFTRTLKDGTRIEFNAQGLQTAVVDRNGNATTYAYDADGRLMTVTNPAGLLTRLTYVGGTLSSVLDPAGRTTTFQYDAPGNLTRITYPDGASESFAYDARHHLTAQTDPRGFTTTYEYDFAGRVVRSLLPDGTTHRMTNPQEVGLVDTSNGLGTQVNPAPIRRPTEAIGTLTDGAAQTLTMRLDRLGAPLVHTDPLGHTTTIERDPNGLPTRITRPNGAIATFTYDSRGNLLSTTEQAIAATTAFTYEPIFNQVTSITDPKGNLTRLDYDSHGNPIRITDPAGNVTSFTYDGRGQATSVTDPLGNLTPDVPDDHQTRFTYDPVSGNLLTTTDPLGNVSALTYDAAGNASASTDAQGRTTTFAYDAMNHLSLVIDPSGGTTRYSYDLAGNLIRVTDANVHVTRFDYDSMNRVSQTTNSSDQLKTFAYDLNGNLAESVDPKGQRVQLAYDAVNQLKTKLLKSAVGAIQDTVTYDYDEVGNLTLVQDSDSKLTFGYDLAGRLTRTTTGDAANPSLTQPVTELISAYDKNDNRTRLEVSGTGISVPDTVFTYDPLNRLVRIGGSVSGALVPGTVFDFSYDPLSRRTKTTLPNGLEMVYGYDDASQLLSLVHRLTAPPNTVLTQSNYTYDPEGNRTSFTNLHGLHSYTYDALDQLTVAIHPLASNLANETYTYDPLGNRLSSHLSSSHRYDAANRLLEDSRFTYAFDANGNLISKTDKGSNATTIYTYDVSDQLTRIDFPDGKFASYRYDALGQRIAKNVNGTITRYVYDNDDILLEYSSSDADPSSSVLKARFTHGPGIDELLWMERDLNSDGAFQDTERFLYHADGLGSIVALTDSTGKVIERYRYDSFGNPTILGPGPDGLMDTIDDVTLTQSAFGNPYLFTAREFDPESGLYYYRARYYDPRFGRFIQEDQDEDYVLLHLYLYVDNNPVNWTDPFGLLTVIPDIPSPRPGPITTTIPPVELPQPIDCPSLGGNPRPTPGVFNAAEAQKGEAKGKKGKPGPSGKPRIHRVPSPSKKQAGERARRHPGADKGRAPIDHPHPKKGKSHFHAVDKKGNKIPGIHFDYPR